MHCTDAQFALSEALDEGTTLPPAAIHHLDGCPACARFGNRIQALDQRLAEPAPRPTAGHHPAAASVLPGRWRRHAALASAALAAAVAIAGSAALLWQQHKLSPGAPPPSSAGPALAQLDEPRSAVTRTMRTAASLAEPWQREVNALHHQARRTAAALLDYAPAPGLSAVRSGRSPQEGEGAASPSAERGERADAPRRNPDR